MPFAAAQSPARPVAEKPLAQRSQVEQARLRCAPLGLAVDGVSFLYHNHNWVDKPPRSSAEASARWLQGHVK